MRFRTKDKDLYLLESSRETSEHQYAVTVEVTLGCVYLKPEVPDPLFTIPGQFAEFDRGRRLFRRA
jgi:hypothetical protein